MKTSARLQNLKTRWQTQRNGEQEVSKDGADASTTLQGKGPSQPRGKGNLEVGEKGRKKKKERQQDTVRNQKKGAFEKEKSCRKPRGEDC